MKERHPLPRHRFGTFVRTAVIFWGLLAALPLPGQEGAPGKSPLSPTDTEKLAKQKVLITNRTFRQSFDPYINSRLPVFITSDAVLNAYHVLLEESVTRLDGRQSQVLVELLRHLWKGLPASAAKVPGDAKIRDAAKRRATLVLAVAMQLLNEPAPGLNPDLETMVKEEVKKVESAAGSGKPSWLGPPDAGFKELDYTRFAPRGIYVRSPGLQRYFRSVAWLQAIPFRVANDEELMAALLTANACMDTEEGSWRLPPPFEAFFQAWHGFIGVGDDLDLASIAWEARDSEKFVPGNDFNGLPAIAGHLVRNARRSLRGLINDQKADAPSDDQVMQQLQIRILPAARLRDAVLLQKTADIRTLAGPAYPSGMQVAAALGSSLAGEWLKAHAKAAVVDEVFKTRDQWKAETPNQFEPPSIYDEYLQCLATLVDAPEKDAPDFMRGEAWQRKSCGTLLAGWTQMRRTWVLQAKTSVTFAGLTEMEPGFVEPEPDFFQRLGELSGRTLHLLSESHALESNSESEATADLERTRDAFRLWAAHPEEEENMPATEDAPIYRGLRRLLGLPLPARPSERGSDTPQESPFEDTTRTAKSKALYNEQMKKWHSDAADFVDKTLRDLSSSGSAERDALLQRLAVTDELSLQGRWENYIRMVSRIESLAHKQLRHVPFTEREREFIRNFGFTLARAMFYDGNSYESPRDDAMKIVDVLSTQESHFHAAAGRPHALYVLYPWQGKEVLCIGSVLPYHEFDDPARLDDKAWKQKLDGPAAGRPAVPDWYAPLLGEKGMWSEEKQ